MHPAGAEFIHADRQTDRHDKGNKLFPHKYANMPKTLYGALVE